jgi:hypothetical protein
MLQLAFNFQFFNMPLMMMMPQGPQSPVETSTVHPVDEYVQTLQSIRVDEHK